MIDKTWPSPSERIGEVGGTTAGWATLGYDGLLQGARYGENELPGAATVAALLDEPARPVAARVAATVETMPPPARATSS